MNATYYEILEVEASATPEEIRKAYRRLLKKGIHPDQGGNAALFRLVQEAYDTLSDDLKRAAYDAANKTGYTPNSNSTSDPGFLRFYVTPTRFSIGNMEWNETRACIFHVSWEGNLTGYEEIYVDWIDQPIWGSDLDAENENNTIIWHFTIDASKAIAGSHTGSIEVKVTDRATSRTLFEQQISIALVVQPIPLNSSISLQGSDRIKCGPLEVGETQIARATINNTGDPIWMTPKFLWSGASGKPGWASDIRVSLTPGRTFPMDISFNVDTKGCTPGTHSAKIEVQVENQTIGVIPVTLQVLKVPVPNIQVYAGDRINFGILEWNDVKSYDIKIQNSGDRPKEPIYATASNNWVTLSPITPDDLHTFPKLLRVNANAAQIKVPGDYVSNVNITHQGKTWSIPIVARIGPRPNLVASQPSLSYSWNQVTGVVEVRNQGGNAPSVVVKWQKSDHYIKRPTINNTWPLQINFAINRNQLPVPYENTLVVEVRDDSDAFVTNVRIPVTIDRK